MKGIHDFQQVVKGIQGSVNTQEKTYMAHNVGSKDHDTGRFIRSLGLITVIT